MHSKCTMSAIIMKNFSDAGRKYAPGHGVHCLPCQHPCWGRRRHGALVCSAFDLLGFGHLFVVVFGAGVMLLCSLAWCWCWCGGVHRLTRWCSGSRPLVVVLFGTHRVVEVLYHSVSPVDYS